MLTYSQLDFQDLREQFGVEVQSKPFLPVPLQPLLPPSWLREFLADNPLTPAITKSEKAVSEAVIYPILSAIRKQYSTSIGLFSGEPLAGAGMVGICDFILSANPNSFEARPPILVLVEAKRQDLLKAVPQCVGEMIAAQRLNQDADLNFPAVYGCVTTGSQWQFLRLSEQEALLDPRIFYYPETEAILGALSWIVSRFQ
ncbi:MAG: hypothetical protein ACRYFX_04785 [Janthinobacterium lividum]